MNRYIHTTLKSIHRDLKSENVLLSKEGGGMLRAKVADFGLSRIVPQQRSKKTHDVSTVSLHLFKSNQGSTKQKEEEEDDIFAQGGEMTTATGTVAYMAPELLTKSALRGDVENIRYGQSVDTFAFGVIMWETLTLERAWADMRFSSQIIDKVLDGERLPIPTTWTTLLMRPPKAYVHLMEVSWHQEHSLRPKFDRVSSTLELFLENCGPSPPTPRSGESDEVGNDSRKGIMPFEVAHTDPINDLDL